MFAEVSNVNENDAIHASKSDLPKIFKVTCSQLQAPTVSATGTDTLGSQNSSTSTASAADASALRTYALLMADSAEEAKK